jgi:hypothetical protein
MFTIKNIFFRKPQYVFFHLVVQKGRYHFCNVTEEGNQNTVVRSRKGKELGPTDHALSRLNRTRSPRFVAPINQSRDSYAGERAVASKGLPLGAQIAGASTNGTRKCMDIALYRAPPNDRLQRNPIFCVKLVFNVSYCHVDRASFEVLRTVSWTFVAKAAANLKRKRIGPWHPAGELSTYWFYRYFTNMDRWKENKLDGSWRTFEKHE